MRVLIAGCGYVGTELGLLLGAAGHQVWGLRRDPSRLPAPIFPIAADLGDRAGLGAVLSATFGEGVDGGDGVAGGEGVTGGEGVSVGVDVTGIEDVAGRAGASGLDAVVYAASADRSTPEAYRTAYVDGVTNLLRALPGQNLPLRRLIFVSSTAVWGDRAGGWVDEETPTDPDGFRGELVLEGEAVVRAAATAGAILPSATTSGTILRAAATSAVILRLGGIYGPGRRRLIERVRAGEARCPDESGGSGSTWSNRIHRDDAAGALAHLLSLEDPAPVYIGVDDEPAPLCDVYTHVAALLQAPPPERETNPPRMRSNKRCSNRRLRASGYEFRFPTFREGYRAIIDGDRRNQDNGEGETPSRGAPSPGKGAS